MVREYMWYGAIVNRIVRKKETKRMVGRMGVETEDMSKVNKR